MNKITILIIFAVFLVGCGKKEESENTSKDSVGSVIENNAANELHKQAMELYRKKDYPGAAELFKKIIAADPEHKLANYNLACTYALMFHECEIFPRESDIFNQLKKAADLDPAVKTRALKDKDFKNFNKSIRFLEALNLLPVKSDNDGWKKIMTGQERWNIGNCGGGVYTSQCDGITFKKDGTFIKNIVNRECMGAPDDVEKCRDFDMSDPYINQSGTYEIKNQKATLKFDSGKSEEMSLPIPEYDSEPCGA